MNLVTNLEKVSDIPNEGIVYTGILDNKQVMFIEDEEIGGYTAWFSDYEYAISEGYTIGEAAQNLMDLLDFISETENKKIS